MENGSNAVPVDDEQPWGRCLLTSSTNVRIPALKAIVQRLEESRTCDLFRSALIADPLKAADPGFLSSTLPPLFRTYPRYQDRPSRRAVQACLSAALRNAHLAPIAFSVITQFLHEESQKSATAATNAFVLLEWCVLVQHAASDDVPSHRSHVLDVSSAAALLLEKCLTRKVRSGLRQSAVAVARRGLRLTFRSPQTGDELLRDLIAKLASNTSAVREHAPYLGVIAGVCARLPPYELRMTGLVKDMLAFYLRLIVGSKTVVPQHVAQGLHDFFSSFVGVDDISRHVAPILEKTILRSPEVVLQGIIPSLVAGLPSSMDVSECLTANLFQPLLSSFKSTNPVIREGAAQAIDALFIKSHVSEMLGKFAETLLSQLRSSKAADQRCSLAHALRAISPSLDVSGLVVRGVAPLAAREANEAALEALVAALCSHLATLLAVNNDVDQSALETILRGCTEKRPTFRKVWLLKLGDVLWKLTSVPESPDLLQFIETAFDKIQEAFDEIAANPIPAAQGGTVSVGYLLIALSNSNLLHAQLFASSKTKNILHRSLATSPKPSFLLNTRVYSRLSTPEDMLWAVRALMSAASGLPKEEEDEEEEEEEEEEEKEEEKEEEGKGTKIAWAQALLFLLTSPEVGADVRREAGRALADIYLRLPGAIGESIVLGIWDWIQALRGNDKDSAALISKAGNARLHVALKQISPPKSRWRECNREVPEETMKAEAVSTLVLCRPKLVPGIPWIASCLSRGVDPGALANERSSQLLTEALVRFDLGEKSGNPDIQTAASQAVADLAFVASDSILPTLVDQIRQDLDPILLSGLGPTEAAIARTPEGVPFIDVLSQTTNGVVADKNRKDYDVLKWEEEIRSQLAQKKGQPKKLTPDQQAKVEMQIARETAIRESVHRAVGRMRRGASFVHSLATGPPTDARMWMMESINALWGAFAAGVELFIEHDLTAAYLACANQVASRLGSFRRFIGIASLRAAGHGRLEAGYGDEPLGDLVTRVLYRLRFAAEQRPFDTVSLSYMLPLMFVVVEKGSVGYPSGEDADAQVLLALEFLSFQMDSCSDPYLPRAQILETLIQCLQRYTQHYRLLKDALLDCCRHLSANIRQDERQVLLKSVAVPESSVRSAVLEAIHTEIDLTELDFSKEIWLACHDDDEEIAETALAIWEENGLDTEERLVFEMPQYLRSCHRPIRLAAARSLSKAVEAHPTTFGEVLGLLQHRYCEDAKPLIPKRDKYGMVQRGELVDPWESRSGAAMAFKALVDVFELTEFVPFMEFLTSQAPVADRNATVRSEMVDAGTHLVARRGQECLAPLMSVFESILDTPDKATHEFDWTNEAVIVFYGSIARHLQPGESRVTTVIAKLLGTLSTPSESVQYAVAGCLPPLVRLVDQEVASYVEQLLQQLFEAKQYAARRGAAYGLAGLVRGTGLIALRQCRMMSGLRAATENKKSPSHRQGALFAYELFALILGRKFEPYVIEVLPQLLACFGDPDASVREACLDAAKACFANLSSFGVHQVLPRLLEGLEETQWRSKKGACDLLGAMAYLDPQQLANSLPDIIPPLTAVLTDTHKEVRASANRSLQRFGEVISNPEVKSLVNILLKALSDPTKYTEDALDGLIKVSFVHYLDAPSLALVVRILERGLSDRSSTKRKAAQIIGSLAHLAERRDLISHLPILVSGLRRAAVDPVPATRATASKALGSLVEKLGEDALPDLIPSLMASLRSDTGAGDRLGSAQALSEVLAGLGTGRLEDTLPTILQNVSSTKPSVREGFMTLFIFLPACFGNSFAAYLSQIIPSILGGLADDLEAVRDIALRAGRLLVKNFASKAIDLLLPELQRGLADDSYRIRLSSVELVGDLLFNLTGISSKTDAEEEDETAAQAGQSLLEVLGEDRRNKVLSSLYICRCDTSGLVRSAAINVWKALVATPRTLRELIPTLTHMIIGRLGSSNLEQKVIAGNALGEVIRKAGEGVLAALLPLLEEGLQSSTDADNRQGICIALREVVNAASPEAIDDYEKKLISIVRIALVDSDADVREAAAESFDSLQQVFGKRAVDHVLPHLLSLLRDEAEAENALSALLTLLTEITRANVILPNLIPTLLTSPITAFNAKALASLASVGGSAMTRRLPIILNTLAENIIATPSAEMKVELDTALDSILSSVDEFDGLNTAMSVMLALIKHDDHRKRAAAAQHLAVFFSTPTVDYSRYNQDLIRVLLISFDDRDKAVVNGAWDALSQLVAHLRKEEMESLVVSTRQVLQQVGVAGSLLPGFSLPKGIQPVLQIFLQGLMNGTTEQRMQSALGISDIIDRTSPDSLKPFITQITGPLIRVVSERSVDVKCAILHTLNQLLETVPTFLRPFLPQLQRTFTKSIADPSSVVLRNRATKALSTLITLTPRVDPLVAELVAGAKTQDTGVRNAMLKGLQEVVSRVGSNMSETSRESILGLMDTYRDAGDDNMAVTNARLLGAMIKVLPPASATPLIRNRVISQPPTETSVLALNAVLLESPSSLMEHHLNETRSALCQGITARSTFVQQNCVLASGKFLLADRISAEAEAASPVLLALADAISPGGDVDTRRLALVVVRTVSRKHPSTARPHLSELASPIFASVRDPVIPVKLAAEAAFLELFAVVESESTEFDDYMAGAGQELPAGTQRMMADYFKRVALRLAGQARERREAEGGQGGLGLLGDEAEDEREVWSVGRVDLGGSDGFTNE